MKKWWLLEACFVLAWSVPAVAHTDITVQQAYTMIQTDPNVILVDVREASEYCGSLGHVPGAYNYPYSSGVLATYYTDFEPTEPILLICHSGTRSNLAADFLDSQGFTQVYDILGGIVTWDDYYATVGCVDNDKDGFNDDLDNYPIAFNPTQAEWIWFGDFSEFAARWQSPEADGLMMEDLINFCAFWLGATP